MNRLSFYIASCLCVILPFHIQAAGLSLDFAQGPAVHQNLLLSLGLLSTLSLAPSLIMMLTSFIRISLSLSFIRNAIGLQQSPSNPVLIGLSLFLTFFVMWPTGQKAYQDGIAPYLNQKIQEKEAFEKTMAPFQDFMMRHTRQKDLELFVELSQKPLQEVKDPAPLPILIPAFMISEMRKGFEMGFLIFLPFLVIDILVSSVLMSLGMMMLSPTTIALPFKLIFFTLIDGWSLLSEHLVKSYRIQPTEVRT